MVTVPNATQFAVDTVHGRVPASRYFDRAFADLERDRLWPDVWQMACLGEDVATPGNHVEYEIGDQSIVIVRTSAGDLRAYHNVCRHRGNRVAPGCGTAEMLRCPYHGWTWSLDGDLVSVPDRSTFGALDDPEYALQPCDVGEWGGLVFVRPTPGGEPLDAYLSPIPDELAPYHLDRYTCVNRVTTPVDANWKTVCDAFLEAYHVQAIHPQLLSIMDDTNITFDDWGTHSRMVMPMLVPSPRQPGTTAAQQAAEVLGPEGGFHGYLLREAGVTADDIAERPLRDIAVDAARSRAAREALDYSGLRDDQLVDDHHILVFPNTVYNLFAGGYLIMRYRPHPDGPERSYFDAYSFLWLPDAAASHAPAARAQYIEDARGKLGQLADQDFDNLPGVQRGMHDRSFTALTLGRHERRLLAMHTTLDRYLFA